MADVARVHARGDDRVGAVRRARAVDFAVGPKRVLESLLPENRAKAQEEVSEAVRGAREHVFEEIPPTAQEGRAAGARANRAGGVEEETDSKNQSRRERQRHRRNDLGVGDTLALDVSTLLGATRFISCIEDISCIAVKGDERMVAPAEARRDFWF